MMAMYTLVVMIAIGGKKYGENNVGDYGKDRDIDDDFADDKNLMMSNLMISMKMVI